MFPGYHNIFKVVAKSVMVSGRRVNLPARNLATGEDERHKGFNIGQKIQKIKQQKAIVETGKTMKDYGIGKSFELEEFPAEYYLGEPL
jgi:hypothetical protein